MPLRVDINLICSNPHSNFVPNSAVENEYIVYKLSVLKNHLQADMLDCRLAPSMLCIHLVMYIHFYTYMYVGKVSIHCSAPMAVNSNCSVIFKHASNS